MDQMDVLTCYYLARTQCNIEKKTKLLVKKTGAVTFPSPVLIQCDLLL